MGDSLHLLVDGIADKPLTEQQVKDFLMAMPSRKYLDMTLIAGPETYQTQGGWCGYVFIAESHISIHCDGLAVHADIFSCKPFESDPVTNYCRDRLKLTQVNVRSIKRGWGNWAEFSSGEPVLSEAGSPA